jgi:hypothetical protein
MTLRESDDRIVPKRSVDRAEGDKPSNIDVGKAVGISRDPDLAPSVLSDAVAVITMLDRSHTFAIGELHGVIFAACTPPRGAGTAGLFANM